MEATSPNLKASAPGGVSKKSTDKAKPAPIIADLRILFVGTSHKTVELNFGFVSVIERATKVPEGVQLICDVNPAS